MLIRFYIYIKTSQNRGLSKVSGSFFVSFFPKEKVITVVFEKLRNFSAIRLGEIKDLLSFMQF